MKSLSAILVLIAFSLIVRSQPKSPPTLTKTIKEKIIKIRYETISNDSSRRYLYIITSKHVSNFIFDYSLSKSHKVTYIKKTNLRLWNKLINSVDLPTLDTIKNAEERSLIVSFTTSIKTYTVAIDETNDDKLMLFFDAFEKMTGFRVVFSKPVS